MKVAVLGNGPSRLSYLKHVSEYDTVAGCNAPWTRVDWTVVLDEEVVQRWAREPDLITVPTYFSRHAWAETDAIKKREFFKPFLIDLVYPAKEYDTSGHIACRILIKNGYTEIDLYGFDSYWKDTIESLSHNLFKNHPDPNSKKHYEGWRKMWNKIQEDNPGVKLNFKR